VVWGAETEVAAHHPTDRRRPRGATKSSTLRGLFIHVQWQTGRYFRVRNWIFRTV
jgi:hypothetical protein